MAVLTAVVASGVSGVFAGTLLGRFFARGRTNLALLFWGVALVLFCAASLALLVGVAVGWQPASFKAYYLFGGVLNVPWLALGSLTVNARSPAVSRWTGGVLAIVAVVVARQATVADVPALWVPAAVFATSWALVLLVGIRRSVVIAAAAVLGVYTLFAARAVVTAGFVSPLPAAGLPEGSELFAPSVRGFAVGGNAVGAITVVVSALVSSAVLVWRRPDRSADRQLLADTRREGYADALARWVWRGRTGRGPQLAHLVRGNMLIALGVAIAAAGGVLSFLGDTVGHAIGFATGVTVMYAGFVRTTRPATRTQPGARDAAGASGERHPAKRGP